MFKIVIAQQKKTRNCDKFCRAMAQKGTVGMILEEVDMPFMEDGSIPDMNQSIQHCLPSRMTIISNYGFYNGKNLLCKPNEQLEMLLHFSRIIS